jgi:hypothetical protein
MGSVFLHVDKFALVFSLLVCSLAIYFRPKLSCPQRGKRKLKTSLTESWAGKRDSHSPSSTKGSHVNLLSQPLLHCPRRMGLPREAEEWKVNNSGGLEYICMRNRTRSKTVTDF